MSDLLTDEQRRALEDAVLRQKAEPYYYVESLSATLARIVCPGEPERGRTFVALGEWMLAADAAHRAALTAAESRGAQRERERVVAVCDEAAEQTATFAAFGRAGVGHALKWVRAALAVQP